MAKDVRFFPSTSQMLQRPHKREVSSSSRRKSFALSCALTMRKLEDVPVPTTRVAPAVSNFAFTAVASKEIRELSAGANISSISVVLLEMSMGRMWSRVMCTGFFLSLSSRRSSGQKAREAFKGANRFRCLSCVILATRRPCWTAAAPMQSMATLPCSPSLAQAAATLVITGPLPLHLSTQSASSKVDQCIVSPSAVLATAGR
mmetsp:Transcript_49382/g.107584  ORF Transcript_49382/g.107584 Transcript_49382/m.107584 type:complete len:203 (+) Transcript_49382:92-700(+)